MPAPPFLTAAATQTASLMPTTLSALMLHTRYTWLPRIDSERLSESSPLPCGAGTIRARQRQNPYGAWCGALSRRSSPVGRFLAQSTASRAKNS